MGAGDREPRGRTPQTAGRAVPDEPLLDRQWHLGNPGGVDLAVRGAWADYSGAGLTVGIWDDGIDYRHPDLDGSYDARRNVTIAGVRHDPAPESPASAHGTAVAGIIAAEADGRGTVGVAHGARIVGVDMFHDPVVTANFARSFEELQRFDVTNHSWTLGPYVANRVDPVWSTFFRGWESSADIGRNGLGTVNVVAAGNARGQGRHTNDSNMSGMPEAVAVAAVGRDGFVTALSTPGPGLLVSAPGVAIWTTDRPGAAGFSDGTNEVGNPRANYTSSFGGTSAAAPMVTGVAALMLEANPSLGWRDVQAILALSARHVGSAIGAGHSGNELSAWQVNAAGNWNGGGLHFSNDYGFGLVDARAAVRLAETWIGRRTSANQVDTIADIWSGSRVIADRNPAGIAITLSSSEAVELEMVRLWLDIRDGHIPDYEVRLTSPGGTTSLLATGHGGAGPRTEEWIYASNAFRGETAAGDWRVGIVDRQAGGQGALVHAELELFGAPAGRNDVFVLTGELSALAGGPHGHRRAIVDTDGGRDTLNAAVVQSASRIDLAAGRAVVDGVKLRLSGIENAFGGDGDDRLIGNGARNRLEGGRGDDVLRGGGGADTLSDGAGRDLLFGGRGRDVFVLSSDGTPDRVRDFEDGIDRLQLSGVSFRDLRFRDRDDGSVVIVHAGDRLVVEAARGDLDSGDFSAVDFLV